MKKILLLLAILILITACVKRKEETKVKKISSIGELLCVYKENRINEDTMYTSYYLYKFDNNGILNGVINNESIEFNKDDKDIKDRYKEELEKAVKDYDDIAGVTVKKSLKDNKYYFEVTMNNKEMDYDTREKFLLNVDRINLYKYYNTKGYTCE